VQSKKAHKTQHSLITLATIGVYIGLLMAGATPCALGQTPSATTRPFSVKDDLERKENLDKKPDDERSPVTASVQVYLEDVEYFLASLGRLGRNGKFDEQKDTFSVAQNSLLPCVDTNIAGRYTPTKFDASSEASRTAMDWFSRGMAYGYSLGDCVPNSGFSVEAADSKFNFSLDKTSFTINLSVRKQSPQRAIDLSRELESTILLYSTGQDLTVRDRIINSTAFRAENDQVFVVTRLPRAGLLTPFVTEAK
jgi:hypothetical protein